MTKEEFEIQVTLGTVNPKNLDSTLISQIQNPMILEKVAQLFYDFVENFYLHQQHTVTQLEFNIVKQYIENIHQIFKQNKFKNENTINIMDTTCSKIIFQMLL